MSLLKILYPFPSLLSHPLALRSALRVLSVSCDRPDKTLSGEPNMWETLAERTLRKELPHVDLILHLGGQVSMRKAFEDR